MAILPPLFALSALRLAEPGHKAPSLGFEGSKTLGRRVRETRRIHEGEVQPAAILCAPRLLAACAGKSAIGAHRGRALGLLLVRATHRRSD